MNNPEAPQGAHNTNPEAFQIPLADLYDERDGWENAPDYTGMGKQVLESINDEIDQRESAIAYDANADPADELAMAQESKKNASMNSWEDDLLIADAEARVAEQNDNKNIAA